MDHDEEERTIALFEERVHVAKRDVVSDQLRVTTSVEERAVLIEDSVERGDLRVERVPVDRPVTEAPQPRQEGDPLIVSVVEERLVVEKRLFVIEEVRITRTSTTEQVSIPETVRVMHATVERSDSTTSTGRDSDG